MRELPEATAATVIISLCLPIDAYAIAKRAGPDYKLKEYNRARLYWLLVAMQLAYPVAQHEPQSSGRRSASGEQATVP